MNSILFVFSNNFQIMSKRFLKVYPSVHFTKHTHLAPQIKESTDYLKKDYVFSQENSKNIFLNNKLKKGDNINEIKRVYYFKLWHALTDYNFTLFENVIQQFLNEGFKYDETVYTLLVHSYILNHKKKNENAFLVIEEMKRAYMHPVIIKANERMLNSFLELEILFCEPSKNLWINILRLLFETSIKLNRERRRKLRETLSVLPPNEVLKLTSEDLKMYLRKEYEDHLLNSIDSLHVDSDQPYEHMVLESYNEKHKIENHSLPSDVMNTSIEGDSFPEKDLLSLSNESVTNNGNTNNSMNYEISDEIENEVNHMNAGLSENEEDTYNEDDGEDFDIHLLKKYFHFK